MPWSVMRCRGCRPARLNAPSKERRAAAEEGSDLKAANPTTLLEKWSTTRATHRQKGHTCGLAKGTQGIQKPSAVGTVVKSTCQTWSGWRAVTTRDSIRGAKRGLGRRGFCSILRTVVGP